jgi:tetratricopeptide (TPR) repeat protein/predicted Ser/Thr protein kinase
MRLDGLTPSRWKQIRSVASQLLDADPEQREAILERECSGDPDLREAALQVCRDFSETDDLFGCQPPLWSSAGTKTERMAGERIGAYRILREVGQGGMGSVYLAARDDAEFTRQVAIKIIRRHGPQRLFQREREILARLDHRGICRLLDSGTAPDGSPYLVMEYVDGVPLLEHAATLSQQGILLLVLQMCDAIRYAHQNLVIHRDLKPGNILVTAAGEAKVLDFGIAKLIEPEEATAWAMTQVVMTPAWASPEQIQGKPASTLSDVYSLGLILYRLLTGKMPAPDQPRLLPSRVAPTLKGDLDSILLKALEADPRRRYQSMEQLAADLNRYLEGSPVEARQGTLWYRVGKFVGRNRLRVAFGVAFGMVMVLGAIGTFTQKRRAEQRFRDVQTLAQAVMFDYQDDLGKLPGSTALRAKMARDTVQYLDHIAVDSVGSDPIQRETALAYRKVGEVQGYGRLANLGDLTGAATNLQKSASILERLQAAHPADGDLRVQLAITLERLANVLSLSGRNTRALDAARRAIDILRHVDTAQSLLARCAAWRELSSIQERLGQNKLAIEAARKCTACAAGLGPQHREDRAWAYERLAQAIAVGDRINQEAVQAAQAAVDLYGDKGSACGGNVTCRIAYLTALEQLGRMYSFGAPIARALHLYAVIEQETAAMAARDPNDRLVLRQLRNAQHWQGFLLQGERRTRESLAKFKASIDTSMRIAESDPAKPEGACLTIMARAKYGEVLIEQAGRVADAETQLNEAMRLSNQVGSDSLTCLDYRKVAVINLARVAEGKGDWEGGLEWRRETVRTALRYAAQTPGEPLGMIIEAGANFELGLGGIAAAKHGDRRQRLLEARHALQRALVIYEQLAAMGNPLLYQYDQWPERAAGMLRAVEVGLLDSR